MIKKMGTVTLVMLLMVTSAHANINVDLKGILRAHPCTLHPDDHAIKIGFSDLGTSDLYQYGGTSDQRFDIRLLNCNINVVNEVHVTLQGTPNSKIPGALALDAGSQATGFAITLKDALKQPMRLGQTYKLPIVSADTTLEFYHRVQVEPDVLLNRGIVPGLFSASATFQLFYP